MHVAHLSLHDFRSYAAAEVPLRPGVTVFVGRNGQGKTNLVEAVDYLARLGSHRVAGDSALVRAGAERAVIRAAVVRDERRALVEVALIPGRANQARINKTPLTRTRDVLGLVRTVMFAPDDLALVKGDPTERRRYLDELLVLQAPRFAGVRSDYDRVLKQRTALLKTAGAARRTGAGGPRAESALSTLEVWDAHLARTGAELLAARIALVDRLRPLVARAYRDVAPDRGDVASEAAMSYRCSFPVSGLDDPDAQRPDRSALGAQLLAAVGQRRREELDRGVSLVGPHRDELLLELGPLPVRGYASHGESWSFALALRLAAYDLLREGDDDPILILDDVFAELDAERRERLAERVRGAEQVLVTAAVPDDVPRALSGERIEVAGGVVVTGVG